MSAVVTDEHMRLACDAYWTSYDKEDLDAVSQAIADAEERGREHTLIGNNNPNTPSFLVVIHREGGQRGIDVVPFERPRARRRRVRMLSRLARHDRPRTEIRRSAAATLDEDASG